MQTACTPSSTAGLPEAEILLCCARSALGVDCTERMGTLLEGGLRWMELLDRVGYNCMLPCLYRAMQSVPAFESDELVPPEVRDELRLAHESTIVRNRLLLSSLLQAVECLQAHGIWAIPFKGPEMAPTIYGAIDVRVFHDIDLLVRRGDLLAARQVLLEQRYDEPPGESVDDMSESELASLYSLQFLRGDPAIELDLHWRVTWPHLSVRIEPEQLWANARPMRIESATIPTLAPEDLFLVLCAHGAKHQWSLLKWVGDVAALLRAHPEFDWDVCWRRAHSIGAERMVALGLYLVRELFCVQLPPAIQQRVDADTEVRTLAFGVTENLFTGPTVEPSRDARWFSFFLHVRERVADKIRFASYLARQPGVAARWQLPLPALLSALYYPARPAWRAMRLARRSLGPGRRVAAPTFSRAERVAAPRVGVNVEE